ncbi:hypothetical protein BDN71DRAFT_1450880 [Pleurotus eryngii]|uniref:Uncharacterized protein n=1 Tax=Pleurotus eryngii TaxID=5323 RepID=A0A9P5ZSS3_PLEER|nr:hypothetical protein BDN71DRAFT_1450880 [Pleurotus eryngii]
MAYVQPSESVVASMLLLGIIYRIIRVVFPMGRRSTDMPPGPSTTPILGNAMEMPRQRLHLQFSKWAKVYGDVFSLKVFNQTIIVVNSPSKVQDVLDKHSLSSSNRPMSTLADMVTPNNMNMGTGRLL